MQQHINKIAGEGSLGRALSLKQQAVASAPICKLGKYALADTQQELLLAAAAVDFMYKRDATGGGSTVLYHSPPKLLLVLCSIQLGTLHIFLFLLNSSVQLRNV